MKKVYIFLTLVYLVFSSSMLFAAQTTVLKFSSGQGGYEIYVTDNKVVGGKAQGGSNWIITGGFYDGKNLHYTSVSSERSGCKSWYSQIYEINSKGPVMLVNVDKCGNVQKMRNQHYWK
jgi:hypothetical protein